MRRRRSIHATRRRVSPRTVRRYAPGLSFSSGDLVTRLSSSLRWMDDFLYCMPLGRSDRKAVGPVQFRLGLSSGYRRLL